MVDGGGGGWWWWKPMTVTTGCCGKNGNCAAGRGNNRQGLAVGGGLEVMSGNRAPVGLVRTWPCACWPHAHLAMAYVNAVYYMGHTHGIPKPRPCSIFPSWKYSAFHKLRNNLTIYHTTIQKQHLHTQEHPEPISHPTANAPDICLPTTNNSTH